MWCTTIKILLLLTFELHKFDSVCLENLTSMQIQEYILSKQAHIFISPVLIRARQNNHLNMKHSRTEDYEILGLSEDTMTTYASNLNALQISPIKIRPLYNPLYIYAFN